ncbi:hypothetical protein [Streptomyces chartreusis]|uniref:hypothetical protein n=1 Tax=Streptomyces chartreusis TaxID=1969 RepID=UPI0037FD09CF
MAHLPEALHKPRPTKTRACRPDALAGTTPFSAGGGVLVGADDGGANLDEPVDIAGRVRVGLDGLQGLG